MAGFRYSLDAGANWYEADAADGKWGGTTEQFALDASVLSPGKYLLMIEPVSEGEPWAEAARSESNWLTSRERWHGVERTGGSTIQGAEGGSLLLAVGVVLVATVGCTAMPQNQVRARYEIHKGFPGYRLTSLDSYEDWQVPLDAELVFAGYRFELESDDVPGFMIAGDYRLTPQSDDGAQAKAILGSMFNRKSLTEEESIGFQREWVKVRPSTAVRVGYDSATGPLEVLLSRPGANLVRDVPDGGEVYCAVAAVSDVNPLEFFRLEKASGQWTYLPTFWEDYFTL